MRKQQLMENWRFFAVDTPELTPPEGISAPVPGGWRSLPGLHNYRGWGLYRLTFTPQLQKGETRVFLHFGSVYRRAAVSLNGQKLGEHNGFQSPFSFEITSVLKAGENTVEVLVNGVRPEGELFGIASVPEGAPYPLEGISQPVSLIFADTVYAGDLYTPIVLAENKALLQTTLQNGFENAVHAAIGYTLTLPGRPEKTVSLQCETDLTPGENNFTATLPLDKILLWSPDEPNLYDVSVQVTTDATRDTFACKTGFKSFAVQGKDFMLNGQPIYLLGFGDDWVYPEKGPSAVDPDFYEYSVRRAKEYGFLFARHHSNYPFEAALQTYDKLGLLIQPELALANVSRELLTPENSEIFLSQWRELITAYRHHPCIAAWCGGNEMEWGYPFQQEIYDTAKQMDPYRPVISTDGNFMACDVNDTQDYASIVPGEYTDYLPYRELSNMFTRDECHKPQIIHEMGNYTTVFDIRDADRWQKCLCPSKRVAAMEKRVQEKNCRGLYDKALQNSFALSKLCHKLNIEKGRLSESFTGYHVWTLNDFFETTQGVLSSFFEDKAFTAAEFRALNAQCLLLWDMDSVVFPAGSTAQLRFKISKYGSDAPLAGTVTAELSGVGRHTAPVTLTGHGVLPLFTCSFDLPDTETEQEYTLTVRLDTPDGCLSNSWSLFSVPRIAVSREKEIYIHYLSRHLLERDATPARHFTIPQPIGEGQLVLTDCLYGGMLEAAENGATMVLFVRPDTFKNTVTRNSFKTPWWDPGEIWYVNHTSNRQLSCVIEKHPGTAMLPYTGAWKLDMFGAVEQAVAVDLDAAGLDAEPLIYGVDEDMHRLGYLFQFRLGKGKVLVCSFNHSRADLADPAVDYLTRSVINYAMSPAFCPEKTLTMEQFTLALNR